MTKPEPATETTRTHTGTPRSATAAAALLGVALGGVFSLVGVLLTNHAFDQRTQRDFLHQQRQSAFAMMLSDEHQTSAQELTVSIALSPNGAGLGSEAQAYTAMVTKLDTDAAEVRLVAGDHAYQLASNVAGDHSQILFYYLHLAECQDAKKSNCPTHTELAQDNQRLTANLDALVDAGRQAIGAD